MALTQTAVYLTAEQRAALKSASARLGRSEADLIREGVSLVLVRHREPNGTSGVPVIRGGGERARRVDELLSGGFGHE